MSGRPKHDLWEKGFQRVVKNSKTYAYCWQCENYFSNTSRDRLLTHRNKCPLNEFSTNNSEESVNISESVPSTVDSNAQSDAQIDSQNPSIFIEVIDDAVFPDILSTDPVSCRDSRSPFVLPKKKIKNNVEVSGKRKRSSSFDSISSARDKKLLDESLAKFLFASNFPLDTVESKHFQAFSKSFRPAYRIPSKEDMLQVLHSLHRDFDSIQLTSSDSQGVLVIVKKKVQDKLELITFVESEKQKKKYLKTWRVDCIMENEEESWIDQLTYIITETKNLASIKFKLQTQALISSHYQTLIEEKCKLDNLWILKCFSKFVKDAQDALIDHELKDNACYLLHEFSSTDLNDEFLKCGGIIDEFRVATYDSCSYWNVLSTCKKNLNVMTQIMVDRTHEITHHAKTLLLDQHFEKRMKEAMNALEPLIAIDQKCEGGDYLIADAVQALLEMEAMEDHSYELISSDIDSMLTPLALTANYLHPVYRGKLFKDNTELSAKMNNFCLDELEDEGIQSFVNYTMNTDVFGHHRIQKIQNCLTYWQAVSLNHPQLSVFARKMLQCPAALPKLNSSPANVNNLLQEKFDELSDFFYCLNF